jgi:hypothetical protein
MLESLGTKEVAFTTPRDTKTYDVMGEAASVSLLATFRFKATDRSNEE